MFYFNLEIEVLLRGSFVVPDKATATKATSKPPLWLKVAFHGEVNQPQLLLKTKWVTELDLFSKC